METKAAILSRRSIRRGFESTAVAPALVDELVRCALHAPSSKNDQPWRLTPVTDRQTLEELANRMTCDARVGRYVPVDPHNGQPLAQFASSVVESAAIVRSVPLLILVEHAGSFTGGRQALAAMEKGNPEALLGFAFELMGIGAAIENMWLAAHASGLAGVFLGDIVIAEAWARRAFAMRGDLLGGMALGYSDAPPHAPKALVDERVG